MLDVKVFFMNLNFRILTLCLLLGNGLSRADI